MNIHRVNRMCSVKGCHNTNSYAISNSGEFGGVIICENCLTDALAAIKAAKETGKNKASVGTVKPRKNTPLFFHPTDEVKAKERLLTTDEAKAQERLLHERLLDGLANYAADSATEHEGVITATNNEPKDGKDLKCPICGKECKNEFGLNAHMRSHDRK